MCVIYGVLVLRNLSLKRVQTIKYLILYNVFFFLHTNDFPTWNWTDVLLNQLQKLFACFRTQSRFVDTSPPLFISVHYKLIYDRGFSRRFQCSVVTLSVNHVGFISL